MSLIAQNYFVLFGLSEQYQQCPKKIKEGYIKLQQEVHPDRFTQDTDHAMRLAVDFAAQVNQAYRTLLDPVLRAIYILKLNNVEWKDEASIALPTTFLIEQMELREVLASLKAEPNDLQLENIKKTIQANINTLTQELQHYLDLEPKEYEKAAFTIRKMQFFTKLTDEVEALESAWQY